MQVLPTAVSDLIADRIGLVLQTLVWVSARNRTSGAVEMLGLWSGDVDTTITVEGQSRLYFGAGGLVDVEPLVAKAGLEVQTVQLTLAPLAPEVEMLLRGYDARLAPIEIHRLVIHPRTRAIVGTPMKRLDGWINRQQIISPSEEQPGRVTLTVTSNAQAGTKGLALKKSDESSKLRLLLDGKSDRFHQYADISGSVPTKWGTE